MFSNHYSTLSAEQVTRVHEASLEVLRTTGIRASHPLALEKLAAAGARVDSARTKVCLPPQMVEDAVATAPNPAVCSAKRAWSV